MLRRLLFRDDGVGMAGALAVSFVVFTLGTTWYVVAVHEIEEASFDRSRTGAVNVAEAGTREMMQILATDSSARSAADTPGGYTTGITGSTCDLAALTTREGASDVTVGEYWVKATAVDASAHIYLIESWGWAPNHDSRQASPKKISLEVVLLPSAGSGFDFALFAGDSGIHAGNAKTIYGDLYSGEDLEVGNQTEVYANDPGYPGTGAVNVVADFEIVGGSNNSFAGTVRVNGYVDDDKTNTAYQTDVAVWNDPPGASPHTGSYMRKPQVSGTLYSTESVTGDLSNVNQVIVNDPIAGYQKVPDIALPTFTWDPTDHDTPMTHGSVASWDTWYASNKGNLGQSGTADAHWVPGDVVVDLQGAVLHGDFVLAVTGDLEVKKAASNNNPSGDPVTMALVGESAGSEVWLEQSTTYSASDNIYLLVYSKGTVKATNATTIYGAIYGEGDAGSNNLEIHYRPPSADAIKGFKFDQSVSSTFTPEPGVWRELPPDLSSMGCNLP